MTDLLEVVRLAFANLPDGHYKEIQLGDEDGAWLFRLGHSYGVGIEVNPEMVFSERFVTARMYTRTESINNREIRLLVLENSEESLRNEFSTLCAQFAEQGEKRSNRLILERSPDVWWKKWKKLLGNSVKSSQPHSAVGELLVYRVLVEKGVTPKWNGPAYGSHDFETDSIDYEVKSTLSRYGHTVTVSGQHQLEQTSDRMLSLLFCRFEETSGKGYSINSLARSLIEKGIDRNELETGLSEMGYEEGSVARQTLYILHDAVREYSVNDSFPRITKCSFIDHKFPSGIVQLTYKIDLASLAYTDFEKQFP